MGQLGTLTDGRLYPLFRTLPGTSPLTYRLVSLRPAHAIINPLPPILIYLPYLRNHTSKHLADRVSWLRSRLSRRVFLRVVVVCFELSPRRAHRVFLSP